MMMHLTAAAAWLALLAVQQPDPKDEALTKALIKGRQKKLESPFLKAAPWTLDYEAALKSAAERKVPVLAYFTTSWFH